MKKKTTNISLVCKESKHHGRQRGVWLEEQSLIERSNISSSQTKSKTPNKNPDRLIQAAITEACVIHTDVNIHNFIYSHQDKIIKAR